MKRSMKLAMAVTCLAALVAITAGREVVLYCLVQVMIVTHKKCNHSRMLFSVSDDAPA